MTTSGETCDRGTFILLFEILSGASCLEYDTPLPSPPRVGGHRRQQPGSPANDRGTDAFMRAGQWGPGAGGETGWPRPSLHPQLCYNRAEPFIAVSLQYSCLTWFGSRSEESEQEVLSGTIPPSAPCPPQQRYDRTTRAPAFWFTCRVLLCFHMTEPGWSPLAPVSPAPSTIWNTVQHGVLSTKEHEKAPGSVVAPSSSIRAAVQLT